MFYGKKIKELEARLAKAEQFEKGVCTVIDNYFENNEKKDLKFSTDCDSEKFYQFVMSVDEKLKHFSKIEESYSNLIEETASQQQTIYELEDEVKTKGAIIDKQEKEIKNLVKEKNSLEIQIIAKNREMTRATSTKGGKK